MTSDQPSAFERYHTGDALDVEPIELFHEVVAGIFWSLHGNHPLPQALPLRFFMGCIAAHDAMLTDIFYHTLNFLHDEDLVRREVAQAEGNGSSDLRYPLRPDEDKAVYALTLKGLSLLSVQPAELFPKKDDAPTIGQMLKDEATGAGNDARKEAIKQGIAGAIAYAARGLFG